MEMSLEKGNLGYQLGRMYAVVEHAHLKLFGNDLPARIYSQCMSHPRMYLVHWITEVKKDFDQFKNKNYKKVIEQELENIVSSMNTKDFPRFLKTKEQGSFSLGYYHQRHQMKQVTE